MDLPRQLIETTFLQVVPGSKIKNRAGGKLQGNARCPICGDSKKSKIKKRFYLYEKNGKYNVQCHNCFYSKSFLGFLKEYHRETFDNLKKTCFNLIKSGDFFKQHSIPQVFQKKNPDDAIHEYLINYFNLSCFKLDVQQNDKKKEKARQYCIKTMNNRHIPEQIWKNYYFCFHGKFDWRVIIPFIDDKGRYYNFQARDVHPKPDQSRKDTKYLFARFDDIELPDDKMYKQFLVDKNKTVFICEGILDSEFVSNSIASCGAGIGLNSDRYHYIKDNFKDRIFCLDSPWTDKAGYDVMCELIEAGEKCFMMPGEHKDCKDMNDLAKKLNVDILPDKLIRDNTLSGKLGLCKLKMLTVGLHERTKKR